MQKSFFLPLPGVEHIKRDLPASLALFIVAIPLCLGIAHASGAPLLSGLLSGIIGGLVVGYFSDSNLSVSGPAAGLTSICLMAITQLGSYQGLVTAVLFAGLLQVLLGVLKMGFVSNYIPSSVIKGMLAAIGLTLILKQFPHLIGYDSELMGVEEFNLNEQDMAEPVQKNENTFNHLFHAFKFINYPIMLIGMASLTVLVLWEILMAKRFKIIPGSLVAVLVATGISGLIQSVFPNARITAEHFVSVPPIDFSGDLSTVFIFPDFNILGNVLFYKVGLTIAIVASLESLLSIEAIEKLDPHKQRVDPNRELLAQGIGNTLCGILGAIPVTAVIVRGTVNISAGARTKYSAIFHGIFILLSVLFLVSVINKIPLAALAAVLCYTGYKLIKPKLFIEQYQKTYLHFIPFLATILSIVLTDLLVGVLIGLLISTFFIVIENYRAPVLRVFDLGLRKKILLGETVSFLHKHKVIKELEAMEPGTTLEIDGSRAQFIDQDILDYLEEFRATSKYKNINLRIIGISDMQHHNKELNAEIEASYEKLFVNNKKWVDGKLKADPEYFRKLTKGQSPEYLFIGCSDSRVPANEITGTDPGEMFVHRNIANLVVNTDMNILSVIQYSVEVLNVKHIIVCGHYGCGGVKAAMDDHTHGLIDKWLRNIKDVYRMHEAEFDKIEDDEQKHRTLVELNVREQVFNLMKTSYVQKNRQLYGFPQVHGWVYDLSEGVIKDLKIDVDKDLEEHRIFKIN
jgi:carbonic anhydrase